MPVEHCLQNDTRPVKASFTPLISVISVCFEYPSCTLQSFQHVIDFNLRVKIAARILCTRPVSLSGLPMAKKFTVWPWKNFFRLLLFIGIGRTITVLLVLPARYWRGGPGARHSPSFLRVDSSRSEFFKAISLSQVTSGGGAFVSRLGQPRTQLG